MNKLKYTLFAALTAMVSLALSGAVEVTNVSDTKDVGLHLVK